uniref:Uncharacterized protein n=1 Tax=Avena sativa TaxID=4498 RepID=A0ACD5YR43_AVESA
MATVLDALVSSSLRKLGQLIEDEVVMTLCVGRDIKRLQQNLESFRAVRQDAEALAMTDETVKLWWKRVSDVMFNVDDVMDLFMVHSHMQHRSTPCFSMFSCFAKLLVDHRVATRIKNINIEVDDIKKASDMYTLGRPRSPQPQITTVDISQTAPMVEPGVVGTAIRRDVDSMVQAIVSRYHSSKPIVFGIEGMGGIGKTTLAQQIYCEQRIRKQFQIHIWLCISENYTVAGLLKQAIRMGGGNCDHLETNTELLLCLNDTIKGKSAFLVLDNVYLPDVWIDLLRLPFEGALDICVLVTTRSQEVLLAMNTTHIHQVNRMSEVDGLMLLMKNSFQPCDGTFQELGLAIVKKCDGLPLAIKAVAGVLSTRKTEEEWKRIQRIQQVYDMLIPAPSLVYIFLLGFPGTMFPEWLRLKPELNIPSLCHIELDDCISCSEVPPAGQMPQLQALKIQGADAVETIGAELLGKGVGSPPVFFPKLELLRFIRMWNLQSWSLETGNPCDNMERNSPQLSLMPELMRLLLLDCPRLKALPPDLSKLVNLKRIHIEGAHSLEEVVHLPAVVWLKVKNNRCLRRISNLCKLQDLLAQDCPMLDHAENLCWLKRVYMIDCLRAQEFRNCLLGEGVLVHVTTDGHNIFPGETLYNYTTAGRIRDMDIYVDNTWKIKFVLRDRSKNRWSRCSGIHQQPLSYLEALKRDGAL